MARQLAHAVQSSHAGRPADGSRLAAIGTWSSRLLLVGVPSLAVLLEHDLETTVIPRSTLFFDIGDEHALLLGMGDGQLAHWRVRTLRPGPVLLLPLQAVSWV